MIKNNDITNKLSDVSSTVVNEIYTSFIKQHRLGNTYDSILTLAKEKKSKSWKSCCECETKSCKDYVFCLGCLCLTDKMCFQKNENDWQKWICFNCFLIFCYAFSFALFILLFLFSIINFIKVALEPSQKFMMEHFCENG